MALIRCPECNHEVSTKASVCPHCGFPISSEEYENNKIDRKVIFEAEGNRSFAPSIVAAIAADIIIAVVIIELIESQIGMIVGFILGLLLESLIIFGLVYDIRRTVRLNNMVHNKIYYDPETNNISFVDDNEKSYCIKLNMVLEFDGPRVLKITFADPAIRKARSVYVGFTTRDEVIKLREFKNKHC